MTLAVELNRLIEKVQRRERTHYEIYKKLSERICDENNKTILEDVARGEMSHYNFWKTFTKKEIKPQLFKIFCYCIMAKVLGLSFTLKHMESGEHLEQEVLMQLKDTHPGVGTMIKEARISEEHLLGLIDEERLKYTGSMVLGLNDAIVELTGALAGFTLALRDPRIIAIAGLIMGISASLSMAASEYLETKDEGNEKSPIKASIYTGVAYVFVVFFLILPFFVFLNPYMSLTVMFGIAILVILAFNYYISVAKNLSFKKRFWEMFLICSGVATLNFGVGLLARSYLGIDA